jgi:hypothetical protein
VNWPRVRGAEEVFGPTRLDGENGRLLTPTIDHVFDKKFIALEAKGDLIVSPVTDRDLSFGSNSQDSRVAHA